MGFVTDVVDQITGKSAQRAAKDASRQQSQSIDRAIDLQEETRDLTRGDLQPFREAGQGRIDPLLALLDTPATQLPQFGDASQVLSDDIAARAAVGGKGLGSGQTLNDLFRQNLLLGEQIKDAEIGRNMNLVNLGQASAAGQANLAQQAGSTISDLLTSQGGVQPAGTIGANNARAQGVNNLMNLAAMFI